MKRQGQIWSRVVDFESLCDAARRALRGKRLRESAAAFVLDLEHEILRLQSTLESGSYRPGAFRNFWIHDPKSRLISAAPFRDRVVHHALVAAIEPTIDRRLIDHTYACRVGKGQHRALARFVKHARRYRYVLMMDIEKYFASVDHAILKGLLRRRIKDRRVLDLCKQIIDAGAGIPPGPSRYYPDDDLFTPLVRPRGLPIGNLTSQIFANLMLDPIDHLATDGLGLAGYARYMDDFVCFSNDRDELVEARRRIRLALLSSRLRLQERKSRVRKTSEALTFLGFTLRENRLRLAPTSVRRWRRRLADVRSEAGQIGFDQAELDRTIAGWEAHASHGDCEGLLESIRGGAKFLGSGLALADFKGGQFN